MCRNSLRGVSSPKLKLTTHVICTLRSHLSTHSVNFQGAVFGIRFRVRDGRNPANSPVEVGTLSNFLQSFICFIHPKWCRISSINSITGSFHSSSLDFFSQNIHWTNLREHWNVSETWLEKGPNSIAIAIYLFLLDVAQSTKILFFPTKKNIWGEKGPYLLVNQHSHGKLTHCNFDGVFPHDCHCGI